MAQKSVEIKLTAEDKASQIFRDHASALAHAQKGYESLADYMKRTAQEAQQAENATQKTADATRDAGDAAEGAGTSFSTLFKSFTLASLAASAIQKAFQMATDAVKNGLDAAASYERSVLGLNSAATSFGQSIDEVNQAIEALTADGLLNFSTTANTLKTLLSTGMGLDQAVQLMQRFKDEAAFGRKDTIDYATAVENLAQAYKTQSSVLGDASGHTDNFSNALEIGAAALGKTTAQLTEAEREQAKFIGYMEQGAYTAGNAAAYADTYAGSLSRMAAEGEKASISLGQILMPASEYVTTSFTNFLSSINETSSGMQDLQAFLVTVAAIINTVGQTVVGVAQMIVGAMKAVRAAISGDWSGAWGEITSSADEAATRIIQVWDDAWDSYEKIYTDDMPAAAQQSANDRVNIEGRANNQIARQLEDATRNFQRQMQQRSRQFQESMRDMIISHRDKSRAIEADLQKENEAYAKTQLQRQKDYTEDIASLEERHAEKVSDIEAQIAEEKQKGLVVDGILYQQANEKKIAKLEEQLRKEQEGHQKALQKRKSQYAEDVAADKERHDAKISQLQRTLNEELAILQKHRADVAKVGEAQKEDDISRLKRQFAEQNAIATRNYNEQLTKIRQQGSSQGSAMSGAFLPQVKKMFDETKKAQDKANNQMKNSAGKGGKDAARSMWDEFKSGLRSWFANLPTTIGNLFKGLDKHTGAVSGLAALWNLLPGGAGAAEALRRIVGRAGGGGVQAGQPYWVGENSDGSLNKTSELFVPGQQGTIYTQQQLRSMMGSQGSQRSVQVSIGTVVNQSNMDPDAFFSALSWQLR